MVTRCHGVDAVDGIGTVGLANRVLVAVDSLDSATRGLGGEHPRDHRSLSTCRAWHQRAVVRADVSSRWACYSRFEQAIQHLWPPRFHARVSCVGGRAARSAARRFGQSEAPADCSGCATPVGGAYVSCPIFDTAGLALQPPQGGFPSSFQAFGSARRSASVLGCVTKHQPTEGEPP